MPALSGTGDLTPGSGLGFTMQIEHAPPFANAILFVGTTPSAIPFHGGTLYVNPVLTRVLMPCDGLGNALLETSVPAGIAAGTQFVLQAWMLDPSAPTRVAGTNGLLATLP